MVSSEEPSLAREIADRTKDLLKSLKKDQRYKFLVQVTVGQNNGQGFRCGSRNFWDSDTDDVCHVSVISDKKFVLV